MNGTAKIAFALLVVSVLLLNPAGACIGMLKQASSPPAHPCCPATPAPVQDDCVKPGCVCVTAPPVLAAAPSIDQAQILDAPAGGHEVAGRIPIRSLAGFVFVVFGPDHRYLSYHQLLI